MPPKVLLIAKQYDGGKPEMPSVGQITYRPGGCIIKPAEPVTQSAKAFKGPRLDTTTTIPPPVIVVDDSNLKSFVHDALNAESLIPITQALHDYRHIRYQSRQPPFNNHQPLTLLLSDAGTNASHYSATLPVSVGTLMLKAAAVLPPQK
ncbi:hypothetical protein CBL_08584 [Carabus blaptoides fortunei]